MKLKNKDMSLIFIKSILAGSSISLAGILYLKGRENALSPNLAAFLFPIGLILICNFDFYLYTGKVCYLPNSIQEKSFLETIIKLLIGLCGNFIGAIIIGLTLNYTLGPSTLVLNIVNIKLNYEWWKLIILGIFCGILIYFAVDGFKTISNNIGKYLVLIMCVAGFIICGFEHCIADMFYFAYAGEFSIKMVGVVLLIVLGNSIGGICMHSLKKLLDYLSQQSLK